MSTAEAGMAQAAAAKAMMAIVDLCFTIRLPCCLKA
jgi:hypothetical protein